MTVHQESKKWNTKNLQWRVWVLCWHHWPAVTWSRQQQVACFCPDSILVRSARNMCHVMPPATPFPNPPPPPSSSSHLPERGRCGGGGREGERPPSLGSQPLNQTLSHPVNLKQSGFNSSCLSVPAPAKTMKAHSAEPIGRQAWGCSKGHRSKDTHKHFFSVFIPRYSFLSSSSSFPAVLQGSWRDGRLPQIAGVRVWYSKVILVHRIEFVLFSGCCRGFYSRCVSSFVDIVHWERSEWIFVMVVVLVSSTEPNFISSEPSEKIMTRGHNYRLCK